MFCVTATPKSTCCGCRACEQACPQKCIRMELDEEGFLYPRVNGQNCVQCGICSGVCPMVCGTAANHDIEQPECYAARHNDPSVLLNSTSGGAFTAIAAAFCDGSYAVFGAAMDSDLVVRHRFVNDLEHLWVFRKSKYVQSDLGDCYTQARNFLDDGGKVLFSGTPCQIAGLRKFLGKPYSSLLTVEVVCHGVPSPKVFDVYKKHLERKYRSGIDKIDFRDKEPFGWESAVTVCFEDGREVSQNTIDDRFGYAFMNSLCLRPSCHECPFAQKQRTADITIGDFWGIEQVLPDFAVGGGVSLVSVNSAQGKRAFEQAKAYMTVARTDFDQAAQYNEQLVRPSRVNTHREAFMGDIFKMPFYQVCRKYEKRRSAPRRMLSHLLGRGAKNALKSFLRK